LLLTLTLPTINELMTCAVIEKIHASPGSALPAGAKLLDVAVDLSAVAAHDCPPISLYRIVLRERAWLRRVDVARTDEVPAGTLLALLSTEETEPLDRPPTREVRVTIAGILADAERFAQDAS